MQSQGGYCKLAGHISPLFNFKRESLKEIHFEHIYEMTKQL